MWFPTLTFHRLNESINEMLIDVKSVELTPVEHLEKLGVAIPQNRKVWVGKRAEQVQAHAMVTFMPTETEVSLIKAI